VECLHGSLSPAHYVILIHGGIVDAINFETQLLNLVGKIMDENGNFEHWGSVGLNPLSPRQKLPGLIR
jgi:hypothetical protein